MLERLFWFSLLFIFYAYAGYPILLLALSPFRRRKQILHRDDAPLPRVSFIITAYNEERRIEAKLLNTFELSYPRENLEIIVASDCSTDKTEDIVTSYASQGVSLVRASVRKGKEYAQQLAVGKAHGEILVFSDVATILDPEGVRNIIKNFSDPTVGCVSSVDRFIDADGNLSGEGAYVRYEMFLRGIESRVNSVVGLSGSFFAARRKVCQNWASNLQSDFNTLLNTIKLGMRGVSDRDSVGYYRNISDEKQEFDRKVRTVLRGITVFMNSIPVLNPLRYGLFSWQLFSHKLCRWLVPFALIIAVGSNIFLVGHSTFYVFTFITQLAFYLTALSPGFRKIFLRGRYLKLPVYFVRVNLSILNAWFRYACGERMVAWSPSERHT